MDPWQEIDQQITNKVEQSFQDNFQPELTKIEFAKLPDSAEYLESLGTQTNLTLQDRVKRKYANFSFEMKCRAKTCKNPARTRPLEIIGRKTGCSVKDTTRQ